MVIGQGDVCWAEMPEPVGSGPGYTRPVVVVQGDRFNRSRLATVVVVPLTSHPRLGDMPGNVTLPGGSTGLPKDSVANVTQITALDRSLLAECVGRISAAELDEIFVGIDLLFDRWPR
ncbi:MAG: type II toxin-antitoxin system PemK/MazF family toxin [Acidobacteriota bacterium]